MNIKNLRAFRSCCEIFFSGNFIRFILTAVLSCIFYCFRAVSVFCYDIEHIVFCPDLLFSFGLHFFFRFSGFLVSEKPQDKAIPWKRHQPNSFAFLIFLVSFLSLCCRWFSALFCFSCSHFLSCFSSWFIFRPCRHKNIHTKRTKMNENILFSSTLVIFILARFFLFRSFNDLVFEAAKKKNCDREME